MTTSTPATSRLNLHLLNFAAYLTVGAVGVVSLVTIEGNGKWLAIGLLLAFLGLLLHFPSARNLHIYFGAQVALTVGVMTLDTQSFIGCILFFILSAQAMLMLPLKQAVLWMGAFVVITAINTIGIFGWSGFIVLLPYTGGYSFFGAFGSALRESHHAKERSERLLAELHAAQEQLQELAIAEERNRMARELHDSLGHRLTVAVVQLEGAQRLIPTDPERAGRMIGAMREQMKEALGDLRRTLATLRAPLEADLPLDQALKHLAQNFQESTGLSVHLNVPAPLPPVSDAHRLALYRAAQESLTNIHKHAGAKQLWLTLSVEAHAFTLTAADDGTGFPPDLNSPGLGLRGLHERAAQLGGELHLEPRPGGGALVRFVLPIT